VRCRSLWTMSKNNTFAPVLIALALASSACERPERAHNDGHQPSGDAKPSAVESDDPRIGAQRDNEGAAGGLPRAPEESADDRTTPPSPTTQTSQSAGPSAAGRVQATPTDDARTPVQAGSRQAPYGHDTSTLADERPEGAEPVHGRK
jgi:hypothetical protein